MHDETKILIVGGALGGTFHKAKGTIPIAIEGAKTDFSPMKFHQLDQFHRLDQEDFIKKESYRRETYTLQRITWGGGCDEPKRRLFYLLDSIHPSDLLDALAKQAEVKPFKIEDQEGESLYRQAVNIAHEMACRGLKALGPITLR